MIGYRRAREDELDAVMDLVIRTFTCEQGIPLELNYLEQEKTPCWFCAEEDGVIIGAVAFFQESDGWHAGRFAIEPEYRGRRIGTRLISYAFTEMFNTGVEEVVMEGRPATVHILKKLGVQITGEPFPFFSSTCTPMRMTRAEYRPRE